MGCDANGRLIRLAKQSFNPRTRMGCDPELLKSDMACISFNPRTRMGCDVLGVLNRHPKGLFQSTHPHGVRRDELAVSPGSGMFQSTHPHGVRHADC